MVGKSAGSMTFAELIGSCLDKPYAKGAVGDDQYDCLGLLASLYWKRGLVFPDQYKDWDRSNYFIYYTEDPKGAVKTAIEFFDSFLDRVSGKVAGDILLVEQDNGTQFVAIYTGNGQAVSSFIRKGVHVLKLDEANKALIVWRPKCQEL